MKNSMNTFKNLRLALGLFMAGSLFLYSCENFPIDDDDNGGGGGERPCVDERLIDEEMACNYLYDPVCGCDGKTYPNACVAKYQGGVTEYSSGPCEKKGDDCIDKGLIDLEMACYMIYEPVCGCDGKTYSNSCEATYRGGVTEYTEGPCEKKDDGCIDESKIDLERPCPENIDFVCGCDGVTYNNGCNAERNGVTKYRKGRCGGR